MGLTLAFGLAIRDLGFGTFRWIVVDHGRVRRFCRGLVVPSYVLCRSTYTPILSTFFLALGTVALILIPFFLCRIGFQSVQSPVLAPPEESPVRLFSSIFYLPYSFPPLSPASPPNRTHFLNPSHCRHLHIPNYLIPKTFMTFIPLLRI